MSVRIQSAALISSGVAQTQAAVPEAAVGVKIKTGVRAPGRAQRSCEPET
jgi:hypothetical protein